MTSDVEAKYDKYVILSSIKKIEPVTLVEGKGATLKDSNGRKYIDAFEGGFPPFPSTNVTGSIFLIELNITYLSYFASTSDVIAPIPMTLLQVLA